MERDVVDPVACTGYGLCAELFPEGIELDDWDYPMIRPEASDPRERRERAAGDPLLPRARTAVPNVLYDTWNGTLVTMTLESGSSARRSRGAVLVSSGCWA